MGRFRKDKGETAKVTARLDKSRQNSSKAKLDGKLRTEEGKPKKSSLKDHVFALGGDDADVELLKDVDDDGAVQCKGVEDPALSKDVSKFLKDLKLPSTSGGHAAVERENSASKRDKKRDKKTGFPKASPSSKSTDVDGVLSKTKGDNKRDKNGHRKKREPATSAPSPPPGPPANALAVDPPKNIKFLFSPAADWYNLLPTLSAASSLSTPSASQISSLTATAANLHATELSHFSSSPNASLVSSSSDQAFLKNIIASGTLSDRLSALTLMVQSSPLHNTRALEVLKGMADKGKGGGAPKEGEKGKGHPGGRDERLKAARAIVDWWVGGGAPARKLRYFRDQPLLHPSVTNQYLLLWYFEDWLKKYFFSLLQTLEALSLDTLSYVRTQALTFIFTLLCERPEQEHNLLRLLVNKLGDTDKSICSRASYYLLQLLQKHPVMKSIVIREITALVMRPSSASVSNSLSTQPPAAKPNTHIKFDEDDKAKKQEPARPQDRSTWNVHARYYAAITLNQIVLSTSEADRVAARALMDVYFRIFREVVGERSVPEDAEAAEAVPEHKGKSKVERGGKGKGKDKGKAKEVQGAAGFAEVQDENSRLVSAILTGVNRAMPFAHFGGADVEFQQHMDTLFLITHTSTFNITLQALTLIHHIVASLPPNSSSASQNEAGTSTSTNAVAARYYRTLYATLHDARLFASSKQAMYLNLLFKSLKTDTDTERVKAFVKRFCQVLVGGFGGTEFVAGGLWLLGELFNNVAGLKSMVSKPPISPTSEVEEYDPRKRDPQYAHASSSPLWELTPLLHHAHPTLCLLAKQLLSRQPLTSSPDLNLHTLTHFLDRFVYKNPKKVKTKGASAMQPGAAPESDGVRKLRGDVQEGPVNEEGWWKRSKGSVPVDQLFFHKYFSQKHEKEKAKSAKAEKRKGKPDGELDDEDVEGDAEGSDEDSDAEEAEIWKAMKTSMPKMGGDDDLMEGINDSDNLPEGLNNSEEEDEDEDESDGPEDVHHSEDDSGAGSDVQPANENDDEDAFSLAEGSDADDLLDLDADVPDGLVEYDGSNVSGAEEWTGFGEESGKSGKRKREDENKGKRKKLRSLPTFASYEDYARIIEDGPEDNV